MTRTITLDPTQRKRMVAILSRALDNERDKQRKRDEDYAKEIKELGMLAPLKYGSTDVDYFGVVPPHEMFEQVETHIMALESPASNSTEMIVQDWLRFWIADYAGDYPDILALVAPLKVINKALSRALERYSLIGTLDAARERQESGESNVNNPLVHEYQLVHNALKALNNTTALLADLKEA